MSRKPSCVLSRRIASLLLLLTVGVLAGVRPAAAQIRHCSSPDLALPDPGIVNNDLVITGSSTFYLNDLDVYLDVSHTRIGDLVVTLKHVDTGTAVVLVDRPGLPAVDPVYGCGEDDILATLDDTAVTPVEDQCKSTPPAVVGTFSPNQPLSDFIGEGGDGTWRLTIEDAAGGNTGTLNEWCLVDCGADTDGDGVGDACGWSLTGTLATARESHTATLLPSGKVLVAGGEGVGGLLSSAELYDPSTGTWASTGSLATPRSDHTATLLASGKVLLAGGYDGDPLSSAELYDPGTGEWASTFSLDTARSGHTATLLASGKVLLAGGYDAGGSLSSAELYDPSTGEWESTFSPLVTARSGHTATLLPSGKVLLAGGVAGVSRLSSAELYDPDTGTWSLTDPLATARRDHTATLLASGQVLLAGGYDAGSLSSAELYDPGTGTWASTGSLATGRYRHTATLLASGQVLLAGGWAGYLSSVELYDPGTGTWASTDSLATARRDHTATLLASGQVLLAGGYNGGSLSSTEIYDPSTGEWAGTGELNTKRKYHTATLLASGKVLLAGGYGDGSLANAELYDPSTGTWAGTGSFATERLDHTATLLASGQVLIAGGSAGLSSAELYDPSTGEWTGAGKRNTARLDHTATLLASGKVLLAGGEGTGGSLSSAELYDPSTGTWADTGDLKSKRRDHTATLLASGKVLLTGGFAAGALASAELYDPSTGEWASTDSLATARSGHTATLLASGKVLLAGGSAGSLSSAELYDPGTGRWASAGFLATARSGHTATLLASGQVLLAGGVADLDRLSSAELYDPSTGTWASTDSLATARKDHTATLLASGQVLLAGGDDRGSLRSAELYSTSTPPDFRRPILQSTSGIVAYGDPDDPDRVPFSITGQFRADSEASSGTTSDSAVGYPLVQLRSLDGSRHAWLTPDPRSNLWDDPMTLTFRALPPTLHPGLYLLTVVTAGVASAPLLNAASEPVLVEMECNLWTSIPPDQEVALGESGTFVVKTQGGRAFQWEKCHGDPASTCALPDPQDPTLGSGWTAIPGATSASYTTEPIQASESGTLYRVTVDGGCKSEISEAAILRVDDTTPPGTGSDPPVAVVTPNGGELWPLSQPDEPNTEAISWTMSDDVRICQVRVDLLFSDDGGLSFQRVPDCPVDDPDCDPPWPRVFGLGGTCHHPGVETTSFPYTLPVAPPAGEESALYKVEVKVTDHAGNVTVAESDKPFYIVEPNNDSIKTLILWYPARMEDRNMETAGLADALDNLAAQPRVQGRIVDLGRSIVLTALYLDWDRGQISANEVLFGDGGIHGYLNDEWLANFTAVEYLVLVGDDRLIPLARLSDGTAAATKVVSEEAYPDYVDLTPDGTRVGESLAANEYLSDDPLATFGTLAPGQLDDEVFLPDLAVGRLVETPGEIVASIATFISHEGILDLTNRPKKVLVSAYDFLVDSGTKIANRWENVLGAGTASTLIGQNWTSAQLQTEICPASDPYGVLSLNGHATHYEVGNPSAGGPFSIEGLDTSLIAAGCDLPGSVVYAVGCHSGLPVAGSSEPLLDHPQDLPQVMLGTGAMAYLGNTGYGWGLKHGVGYSERLVEIFTEELTAGGTVVLGDAVQRTKLRYFLESTRFDAYDEKVSMQWTLYGFPMYALQTATTAKANAPRRLFEGPPPRLEDLPRRESFGPVTLERRPLETTFADGVLLTPPPYLTRLDLTFDFSAAGVYKLFNAAGLEVPSEASPDYCDATQPDPNSSDDVPQGCYYTLNNVSSGQDLHTGATDRPLQPMFIYDSRLSGTSFHGFLWKGGTYVEEESWVPLVATLQSNVDGGFEERGPLNRHSKSTGKGKAHRGATGGACDATDTDVSSLVLETGELISDVDPVSPMFTERHYEIVDVEILYFNDTGDPNANCDRTGPGLAPSHQVTGSTVHWTVAASDPAGVWRVLVVWNDGTVETGADGQGRGRWQALELELVDGTWQGSVQVVGSSRISYFVQAVDTRGNVSLRLSSESGPPPSGVPLDFPEIVEVDLASAEADLAVSLLATPNPVAGLQPLAVTVSLTNLGPEPAAGVSISAVLPPGLADVFGGGSGWSCATEAGTLACTRGVVEVGPAPVLTVVGTAPPAGSVELTVTASTVSHDAVAANDSASVSVAVLAAQADLVLTQDVSFAADLWSPIYTLTITNDGPDAVDGATVTDLVPGELTNVGWGCAASAGAACTAAGAGDVVDRVTIPAGGWVRYTVSTVLAPGYADLLTNTATVTVPSGVYDPALRSNSSTVTIDYSGSIFADGFESGDLTAWSSAVGEVP